MTFRQSLFAFVLVLAASCGGGGGASLAAQALPSWTLSAFNVDGTEADTGGVPTFNMELNHYAWSATLQTASTSEPLRVRLYLSGDDILGDTPYGGNAVPDTVFFDEVFPAGGANPLQLACTYDINRVLSCTGDASHSLDRDAWHSGFDVDAFMIVRVCSVAEPGHCDAWPAPVHFHD